MASNLYHLLGFIPATRAFEMPQGLEALAQALVRSGKLRINADTERNFVRLGISDNDKTFTARELNDPRLRPATRTALARYVATAEGEEGFARLTARLQSELKKARGVSADKEIKVARVLVQSAHPSVILLLLQSGTEIFMSYSHNVGDLMAVHQWEKEGTASGLQATATSGTAVYVSAGGDPFFEGEHKHYTTDGFPALARMVVIAGQELGHFADLKRSAQTIIGRHSTDSHHVALRADPKAQKERIGDIACVSQLQRKYVAAGLHRLLAVEKAVAFYHKRLRYSPPWCWHQLHRFIAWICFTRRCRAEAIDIAFTVFPYHRHGETVSLFLSDMAFNLTPDADVYRNPDPLAEEAIAVIEAVARVPQQVHKWGHAGVLLAWPGLHAFYFGTIIPAVIAATGTSLITSKMSSIQRLKVKLRHYVQPKPSYYPEKA